MHKPRFKAVKVATKFEHMLERIIQIQWDKNINMQALVEKRQKPEEMYLNVNKRNLIMSCKVSCSSATPTL